MFENVFVWQQVGNSSMIAVLVLLVLMMVKKSAHWLVVPLGMVEQW